MRQHGDHPSCPFAAAVLFFSGSQKTETEDIRHQETMIGDEVVREVATPVEEKADRTSKFNRGAILSVFMLTIYPSVYCECYNSLQNLWWLQKG